MNALKFLSRERFQWTVIGLACFSIFGCQSPSQGPGSSTASASSGSSALRVGVAPDLPPFVYRANGAISGLEVELAQGLSKRLGRPIEWVTIPRDRLIESVSNGKCDIVMSGVTIRPSHGLRVNYCNPYLGAGQMALVRTGDFNQYMDQYSVLFHSGKVGVVKGSTAESWAPRAMDQATRLRYDDIDSATRALIREKVDLVIDDSPIIWHQASKFEGEAVGVFPILLTNEYLGWAVNKESTDLLASANAYLDELKESDQLNELVKNWISYAR